MKTQKMRRTPQNSSELSEVLEGVCPCCYTPLIALRAIGDQEWLDECESLFPDVPESGKTLRSSSNRIELECENCIWEVYYSHESGWDV